ncbi:ABC transporter permease subunit [Candidatus Saccharibacteria bacterium]|nr:ABC transporter permease subunit [Candidatus Saccharibacteria bacterium]
MKHIIRWNFWQRRWSVFWWCLGITAFVSLELGVYPSVKSQAAQLNEALSHLPESVRALIGGSSDLFSPVGYLNSRLFYLLLPLLLSILIIGLGSSLIAREETDGTIELLLGRPVSRGKLLLAKALAGLLVSAVVVLVSAISITALVKLVGLVVPLPRILFAVLLAALLALFFGMIAFCLAAMGAAGRGASIGVASLVGLGSYIIASLESVVDWLSWPAKILPYHYYNPTEVLNGFYAWKVASIFTIAILILGVISWLSFRRRDINV